MDLKDVDWQVVHCIVWHRELQSAGRSLTNRAELKISSQPHKMAARGCHQRL